MQYQKSTFSASGIIEVTQDMIEQNFSFERSSLQRSSD
jgi:hypothetical protein